MKYILRIDDKDNVGVCTEWVKKGDELICRDLCFVALEDIDFPHKVAIEEIAKFEAVIKYGHIIGYAKNDIHIGEWVHTHNITPNKPEDLQR